MLEADLPARPSATWRFEAEQALSAVRDVGVAALCLGLADLALHYAFFRGRLPEPLVPYVAHLLVVTPALMLSHLAPAVVLVGWLGRRLRRPALAVCAALSLFGLSLQAALLGGAGIRMHPLYLVLSIACAVLVPLGFWRLGALALQAAEQRPRLLPFGLAILFLELSWALTLFTHYRGVHAHVATLMVLLVLYALRLYPPGRWLYGGAAALAALAAAVVAGSWSSRDALEGCMLRTSYAASPLLCELPLPGLLRAPPERVVKPGLVLSQSQRREYAAALAARPAAPAPVHADSLIVLVLESVRWDHWADPQVTPAFHALRKHGAYFPRAVASYPATPLSYGAIFTSQPPSVLLATGSWQHARPFDHLLARFEVLALSRPDEPWFERDTLTDFFLPRGTPVSTHESSAQALDAIRRTIEANAGKRFFAWAHLYEPHAPYEQHPEHDFGGGVAQRYRSEVAYLDAQLGRFLRWFDARPEKARTLVVVVADHGEGLGDPSGDQPIHFHSFDVRNALTAVPLFVQGPGLSSDVVETELVVSQLDVLPTIFDVLGQELPASYRAQGRSLCELLAERPERSVVSEQFHLDGEAFYDLVESTASLDRQRRLERFEALSADAMFASKIALWRGDDKLIYDRVLRRSWLFDVARDPWEHQDLAAARPAELARMQAHLDDWLRQQAWVIDALRDPPGSR